MVSRDHRIIRLRGKSTYAPARARIVLLKRNFKVSFEILGKMFDPVLKALYGFDVDAHLGVGNFLLQQRLHLSQKLIVDTLQILHHIVYSAQRTAESALVVLRLCLPLYIFNFTTAFKRRSYCLSATCCCLINAPNAS